MSAPRRIVETFGHDKLRYDFDNSPVQSPSIKTPGIEYKHTDKVDATPCYMHDQALVEDMLAKVTEKFPIPELVRLNIFGYETFKRSNGECMIDHHYSGDIKPGRKEKPWQANIYLFGKRTPPMPAMTRYLVSHEYGHAVDHWIGDACKEYCNFGLSNKPADITPIRDAYSALRVGVGDARVDSYGPCTWHLDPAEVIANDFRILVCGVEEEFWPHSHIPHPKDKAVYTKLMDWWQDKIERVVYQTSPSCPVCHEPLIKGNVEVLHRPTNTRYHVACAHKLLMLEPEEKQNEAIDSTPAVVPIDVQPDSGSSADGDAVAYAKG